MTQGLRFVNCTSPQSLYLSTYQLNACTCTDHCKLLLFWGLSARQQPSETDSSFYWPNTDLGGKEKDVKLPGSDDTIAKFPVA